MAVNVQWKITIRCFLEDVEFSNFHKGRIWAALSWHFIVLIVRTLECGNTFLILFF